MTWTGARWSPERAELVGLALDGAQRAASARVRHSRLLRWRYGPPHADQLLILPQDIRAADPSFAREVAEGQFGLAGSVANIGTGSPFDIPPVSRAWARALHGFGWLKHLRAAHEDEAEATARLYVLDWISRHRIQPGNVAFERDVVARRVISWIANAPMLLDDIEPRTYATITDSLGSQIVFLGASARAAPVGYPRLLVLIALVLAGLCVSGHGRRLDRAIRMLSRELQAQILPDGGHISRNPAVVIDLLLDVLPLRHCFVARQIEPPPALDGAIAAMTRFLHMMRLGDGNVARFNGVGPARHDEIATLLTYVETPGTVPCLAQQSHYVRLARGDTVVVMDAGSPPPLALSGAAQAGCLSFEFSKGATTLIANCGMPGTADPVASHSARATASHNTLCLAERSSALLVRNSAFERRSGMPPLRNPSWVTAEVVEDNDGIVAIASHNGYERNTGLIHTRKLQLSADGRKLSGVDQLSGRSGILRLAHDFPFAIHFHLHPDVSCRVLSAYEVELTAAEDRWLFSTTAGRLTIEESIHYATASGPIRSLQIVLQGATAGETQIEWSLENLETLQSAREDEQELVSTVDA